MPRVCVGLSIYRQRLEWVRQAIESVRNQTYSDWELIVRLDGSAAVTAEGRQWLQEISRIEPRLHLIEARDNLGTFGSYRAIFQQTSAEFLVQLDADDWLAPEALELAVQAIRQSPSASFLYSLCFLVDANGQQLGLDQRACHPWSEHADLVQFITFHLRLIRRTAYEQVGGYQADRRFTGDYDLSLKLAELAQPVFLKKPLYFYRLHASSESQRRLLATHCEAVTAVRQALHRRGLAQHYALLYSPRYQCVSLIQKKQTPILVAGMHRSGTSLLSRLLQAHGVDFGVNRIGADADNPDGYEEDAVLLKLQRQWFSSMLAGYPSGWPDWGWTPQRSVNPLGHFGWRAQAAAMVQATAAQRESIFWGWKDPRSTLILPFWKQIMGDCRIAGIYRSPWDLSDALQRIRHGQFRCHPEMILPLWQIYNERLADAVESQPDRCILVHAETLAAAPDRLTTILRDRWCLDHSPDPQLLLAGLINPGRLRSLTLPDPIEALYRLVYPGIMQVWDRLQYWADCPAPTQPGAVEIGACLRALSPAQPLLSVVIPTFNPCHFLLEAVASVLRYQRSSAELELILVDDGSTHASSRALLDTLESAGCQIIRQSNAGLAAARNAGIRQARGELILPLDDDNRLLAPYLQQGLQFMLDNPSVDLLYGNRVDFGARHQHFEPGPLDAEQLIVMNRIDACAVFRRSLWLDCGGYDEQLTALEDWDFWLSAVKHGVKAMYLRHPCFEYRVRENSMLQTHLAQTVQHHQTIDYLRRKHGLPIQSLIGGLK